MLKNITLRTACMLVVGVALLQNCKKSEDTSPSPTNEITDAGGLTITLTYDKTPATVDLDLYIYTKSTYATTSNPKGANIGPADGGIVPTDLMPVAPDGDYTVVVAYKTGTTEKNYTLSFKGITDKKTYTVNGTFAANLTPFTASNYFGLPRGNNLTLKKAGNTYTITP